MQIVFLIEFWINMQNHPQGIEFCRNCSTQVQYWLNIFIEIRGK